MKIRAVWIPGTDAFNVYLWEETPSGNAMGKILIDSAGEAEIGYTIPEEGSIVQPTLRLHSRELRGLQSALNSPDVTTEVGGASALEDVRKNLQQRNDDYHELFELFRLAWSSWFRPPFPPDPGMQSAGPPPTPIKPRGVPNGNS